MGAHGNLNAGNKQGHKPIFKNNAFRWGIALCILGAFIFVGAVYGTTDNSFIRKENLLVYGTLPAVVLGCALVAWSLYKVNGRKAAA